MMRYAEIITEGRIASLFHAFREEKYADIAVQNNELAATTTQRFWADGKRRKDNDPEYEGSYWMKGISVTRDIRFATKWGTVIFELDQAKITQRYKITPFNWGYSIPSNGDHKREREEFIVVKSTLDKYDRPDEEGGGLDLRRFKSPEGAVKPLSDFLKGIYLSTYVVKELSVGAELLNHPLLKGYYIPFAKSDMKIIPLGTDLTNVTDGLTPLR